MSWIWIALGWTGQAMFFSRFLVQWWASERAGTSVAPRSFWWLSLLGTLMVGTYTFVSGEAVLLPVFAINLAIYVRNLLLADERRSGLRVGPRAAAVVGLAGAAVLWASGAFEPRADLVQSPIWLSVGVVGTAVWSTRFLLQWWSSERAGESCFPPSFWWVSLVGNALLLAYALHLGVALYIAGFAIGPFVQIRNLMLIYRPKGELKPAGSPTASVAAERERQAAAASSRSARSPALPSRSSGS